MADTKWFSTLESRIYTVVSYRLKKVLGDKYGTIAYTTDGASTSKPHFPTWYLHEITSIEVGRDLDNSEVNAVDESIEVVVYAKDKTTATAIAAETVVQMKLMRFNVVMMPLTLYDGNVFQTTARYRRIIGAGDTDIVI